MAKDTMGKRLPRQLEEKLRIVGEQIRLARLRRNLTQKQIANPLDKIVFLWERRTYISGNHTKIYWKSKNRNTRIRAFIQYL